MFRFLASRYCMLNPRESANLDPEQERQHLEQWWRSLAGAWPTQTDELVRVLRLIQLRIESEAVRAGADLLPELLPRLDDALEAEPDHAELRQTLVDANQLAMAFTGYDPQDYSEWPFYQRIQEVCRNQPGALRLRYYQAYLGALNNYQSWLQQGGQPDALPAEVLAELQEWDSRLPEIMAEAEQELAREEQEQELPGLLLAWRRTRGRFHQQVGELEQALDVYGQMRAQLEGDPETLPVELAEIDLEMGLMLAQSRQWAKALPLLRRAQTTFEAQGEDHLLEAGQAESWIAECEERLAAG